MTFHQYELNRLEKIYGKSQNQIAVLYGNKQSGVHQTMMSFLKNKAYFYYHARSCSNKLQLQFFYDEIREGLPKGMSYQVRYSDLISAILSIPCSKRIIVIDEFQHMLKSSPEFMDEIVHTIHDKWNNQPVLFLLCSTSENYIENDMLDQLQKNAYEIGDIIKLHNLSFEDFRTLFNQYEFAPSVELYSIVGPYLNNWNQLNPELSLAENICKNILTPGSYFYEKGIHILPDELREPSVYNTILEALAGGKKKLNDLYKITGFERAKISVYLKNLAGLKIAEKMESFDTPGKEQTQKGIYRITDPFTQFWYCFVYPHLSKLVMLGPEKFYRKYIENNLRAFSAITYANICKEYLKKNAQKGKLGYKITQIGTWYGKVGNIDIIASDDSGSFIIGLCNFEKSKMSYGDYEWNNYCLSQAKVSYDRLYLFSQNSFDEKIKKEAKENPDIVLIENDMFSEQ